MNVIHISSSYQYTEVYDNLFKHLYAESINQIVYSALKRKAQITALDQKEYDIVSSKIVNKYDSLIFFHRINKTYKDIISKIDISSYDIIHSHFLFTDGGLALKLHEQFGIPYIVTIRNTDISLYLKYFPHLKKLALRIMKSAKKIVFISPKHRRVIENAFPKKEMENISKKIVTIPNGTNIFWRDNINIPKKTRNSKISFLFIGEISKNKNLELSISLLSKLKQKFDLEFTIVGPPSDGSKSLDHLLIENDWIKYLGEIRDKKKLKELYRNHTFFMMLSKYETFGLVYTEAMSQGTPVFYSKGQGIDGYFPEGFIGYHIDTKNPAIREFESYVGLLLDNYESISKNCIDSCSKFDWKNISKVYHKIYLE